MLHRFLALGTFVCLLYVVGQGTLTTTGVGVWFVPSGGGGVSTTAVVTHAQGPSTEAGNVTTQVSGTTTAANYSIWFPLPDAVLSGNGVVVAYRYHSTPQEAATVTDDQSNTYTCISEAHDSTNNFWMGGCYSLNLTNGPRVIKVTLNSGCGATGCTDGQVEAGQLYNVTSFDTSSTNLNSATTTLSAGSLTTAQPYDLVYQAVSITGTKNTGSTNNAMPTITFGSGWNGVAADPRDGISAQWEAAASAGSVTPSETAGSSVTALSVALAFKSGNQGTLPSGMYIACRGSYNSEESSALTSIAMQMPCMAGNMLHTGAQGGESGGSSNVVITSVTDGSNTWGECTPTGTSWSTVPWGDDWYASNATLSNTEAPTFNLNWHGNTGDVSLWWEAVAGASAIPGCSGHAVLNASSGPTLTGTSGTFTSTYQPQASSALNFGFAGVQFNTLVAISSPCAAGFDAVINGGESVSGPWQQDQNNLRSHCATSGSNAAQNWTGTFTASTPTVGGYGGWITSYPAPGATWFPQAVQCNAASATDCQVSITVKGNNDALLMAALNYNSTARTFTKACLDGNTTCSTGTALTNGTNCTAAGSASLPATTCFYLFNVSSGSHTVTLVLSGSASNIDFVVYEGAGISAFDLANNTHTGSVSGGSASGPSITTTGNPGLAIAIMGVSGTATACPASGNAYNAQPSGLSGLFADGAGGYLALVSTSAAAHSPACSDASGTFNSTNAAFK